jgi:hypothetical protein
MMRSTGLSRNELKTETLMFPPRQMADPGWRIELEYSSDTRYMDKVIEKTIQLVKLCKMVAAEEYDVMLLPIVLESAGTFPTEEIDISNARRKNLYSKVHLHSVRSIHSTQSTGSGVPTTMPGYTKVNLRSKGKDERHIASFPTQSVHKGRTVNRPTHSRLTAFSYRFIGFLRSTAG